MQKPEPLSVKNKREVDKWLPLFREAACILVLEHKGVGAHQMSRYRRAIHRAKASTVVLTRNAWLHIAEATDLAESLSVTFETPTAFVLAKRITRAFMTTCYELFGEEQWRGSTVGILDNEPKPRLLTCWLDGEGLAIEAWERLMRSEWVSVPLPAPVPSQDEQVFSAEALTELRRKLTPYMGYPEEQNAYPTVIIEEIGPSKISVIKILYGACSLGLKMCKEHIDSVEQQPLVVSHLYPDTDVKALASAFREAGASVRAVYGNGWFLWDINEAAIFAIVPQLWLNPDWKLTARLFRQGGNGNGAVRAILKTQEPSDASTYTEGPFFSEYSPGERPVEACLQGDGTPLSYLHASLLIREFREFGALWHGVVWGAYGLFDTLPENQWTWKTLQVELVGSDGQLASKERIFSSEQDWRPRVLMREDGTVIVTFFSTCSLGSTVLICHIDLYEQGSYQPVESHYICCATGLGGYVV